MRASEIVIRVWPFGMVAALWWALVDFILDRVGPAPARWVGFDDRSDAS